VIHVGILIIEREFAARGAGRLAAYRANAGNDFCGKRRGEESKQGQRGQKREAEENPRPIVM